jgi:general secretion pathway protein L
MNRNALATTILNRFTSGFSRWIDGAASFIASSWQFATPCTVKLVEAETGEFTICNTQQPNADSPTNRIGIADGRIVAAEPVAAMLRGSRIELTLRPDRFLFRPLELPKRASEFLDGIVRAQIDRLTPWNALEAAFGWSKPSPAANDRIMVTVVATARSLITPYIQGVANFGVQSIAVFTTLPEPQAAADLVMVAEERSAGFLEIDKIRRILSFALMTLGAAAVTALTASAVISIALDAQNNNLAQQITSFRAAVATSREAAAGSLAAAQHTLEVRKHTAPPSVIAVEALSRILPDDTYTTELRIEDNKIQLVGVTHNAPALIDLIERSGLFARATFFAPTTHSSSEAGEHFHIEALIQQVNRPRS